MRPGQQRVVDAFVAGRRKKQSAFSTDGTDVWSYGMLIAHRTRTGRVLYLLPPCDGGPAISGSTSAHLGACASGLAGTQRSKAFKDTEKFQAEVQKDRQARRTA